MLNFLTSQITWLAEVGESRYKTPQFWAVSPTFLEPVRDGRDSCSLSVAFLWAAYSDM